MNGIEEKRGGGKRLTKGSEGTRGERRREREAGTYQWACSRT